MTSKIDQKKISNTLKCAHGVTLERAKLPLLMGILNLTPDSFSDGGQYLSEKCLIERVEQMCLEGAHIIDVGAESTRPQAIAIDEQEEISRLNTSLATIIAHSSVPLSIDTYKANVAKFALQQGVHIVNDIWGLQGDPDMARVVADFGALVVVMHNRKVIDAQCDIVADVHAFFERSIEIALMAGVNECSIVLDPGIGFGKTFEQNIEVLRALHQFKKYPFPLLLGVSRKSYINFIHTSSAQQRLAGTLATHLWGLQQGCDIFRVHDVFEALQAFMVYDILQVNA